MIVSLWTCWRDEYIVWVYCVFRLILMKLFYCKMGDQHYIHPHPPYLRMLLDWLQYQGVLIRVRHWASYRPTHRVVCGDDKNDATHASFVKFHWSPEDDCVTDRRLLQSQRSTSCTVPSYGPTTTTDLLFAAPAADNVIRYWPTWTQSGLG